MEYHDDSNCSNDYQFAHELFLYLRYKRYCYRKRSPRLVRKFLLQLCEKYPRGFSDNCFIFKNMVLSENI